MSKSRHIDAYALLKKLMEDVPQIPEDKVDIYSIGKYNQYLNDMQLILNAPTVEERRHGHWNKVSPAGIYECSNCGDDVMTMDIECYRYCHHCGARMDEIEVEE